MLNLNNVPTDGPYSIVGLGARFAVDLANQIPLFEIHARARLAAEGLYKVKEVPLLTQICFCLTGKVKVKSTGA